MKTAYKFALVSVPLAIVSFILSRIIWPDPAGMAMPAASLVPFFMVISAFESIAFGLGVAFALFGWDRVRTAMQTEGKLALAAFISSVWVLISWWPHDNMHRVNGMEHLGLLRIEYIFHVTLIIAGLIIAAYLWRKFTPALS